MESYDFIIIEMNTLKIVLVKHTNVLKKKKKKEEYLAFKFVRRQVIVRWYKRL